MPQRIKLRVAYDGGPFAGWQSQVHGNTVQDKLEAAIARVTGQSVRVHGAGRTDTGVHALGQCAHIDLENSKLSQDAFRNALNAVLPPALRVLQCQRVPPDFHARFSAKGKVYRYRIFHAPVLLPLEYGRVWHIPRPLDIGVLQSALSKFLGRHDFAGFAANRGQKTEDTVRTISKSRLNERGPSLTIEFEGDGFLYKMVRLMVGSAVLCSQGKMAVTALSERLKNPAHPSRRLVAPAAGLFLLRVRY